MQTGFSRNLFQKDTNPIRNTHSLSHQFKIRLSLDCEGVSEKILKEL